MKVLTTPDDIPSDLTASVVTVGIFDGVHLGHKAVLEHTVAQAKARGIPSIALTFDPHPAKVHHAENYMPMVMGLADRLERLEAAGIDYAYVQHYTLEYAQASPEEFVRDQLCAELHARCVVVGEDVRFGKGNAGDGALLKQLGEKYGFDVELLSDRLDASGTRYSSTRIRALLATGDVSGAREVLGRAHRLRGVVVPGFQRGRELGFPTANIAGEDRGEVPADGVYAGWLVRRVPGGQADEYLPAAISVGTNPQFDGQERTVEAHVLGRADLNLYGEDVALEFTQYLRPMLTFGSVDELLAQMDDDLARCAQVLGVPKACRVDPKAVTAQAPQH